MSRTYTVYILSSRSRALYVGVTSDLIQRLARHSEGYGHTGRYAITRLVYCEQHATPKDAICREKQIKAWRREKKVALIERDNPQWRDLSWGRYPEGAEEADWRRDPSTSSG